MRQTCEVGGCEEYRVGQGLCRKHYMRMSRKGSTDDQRKNGGRVCTVEGCGKPRHGGGLCKNHWGQQAHKAALLAAKAADPRDCGFCGKPIPPEKHRRGEVSYCDRTCKSRARAGSPAAQASALRSYYKRRYNLSLDEVEQMVATGSCDICGTQEWNGRHKRPAIDHDHATGKVRGLLCNSCNLGLGYFHDDPAILRAAIRYLAA